MDGSILLVLALQETTRVQQQPTQSPSQPSTCSQSLQPRQLSERQVSPSGSRDDGIVTSNEGRQQIQIPHSQDPDPQLISKPGNIVAEEACLTDSTNTTLTQKLRRSSRIRKTTEKVKSKTCDNAQKDSTLTEESIALTKEEGLDLSGKTGASPKVLTEGAGTSIRGNIKRKRSPEEGSTEKDNNSRPKDKIRGELSRKSTPVSDSDLPKRPTKRQKVSK